MKKKYHSDLKRLRKMKDEEIDYSDIPELDEAFFENAVIVLPKPKASVCIRLDQEEPVKARPIAGFTLGRK